MINILNAGNEKVADGLLITVLSIIKHTNEPINMVCFTMDLTDIDTRFTPISSKFAEYVDKILKEKNPESEFTLMDLTSLFKKELINSVNLGTGFTPYTMLRLLADEVPEIKGKFIYLDTDVIINNDISELFNIDISNYEIACVKDIYNWASPSRWGTKNYFNAGVLLLNIDKIRETGYFKKARHLVNTKKMLYCDQDALNKTVTSKLMLPVKFNAKDKYFPEIVVHHFCNVRKKGNFFKRIKPWEVELVKTRTHAYDDILDDYLARKQRGDWSYPPQ